MLRLHEREKCRHFTVGQELTSNTMFKLDDMLILICQFSIKRCSDNFIRV